MASHVHAIQTASPAASNRRVAIIPAACAAAAVVLGAGVLIGYLLDIDLLRRLAPSVAAMSPITAVAVVLGGAAAMPLDGNGRARWQAIPASLLALIALLQLADHAFGHALGFSSWLFADTVTLDVAEDKRTVTGIGEALCLAAVAAAVGARSFGFIRPAQFVALAILVPPFTALIGYAYSRTQVTGTMPPYAALAVIALAVALLSRDARFGIVSVLASRRTAGLLARIVLPLAVALPFVLDWTFLVGVHWGVLPFETSLAMFVSVSVVASAGLLLYTLAEVDRIDRRRRRAEWRLSFESDNDPLTGALNRKSFYSAIDTALRGRNSIVLFHLDLDGFKAVNERMGEPAGEDVLRYAVQRLLGVLRPSDLVARLGGAAFGILVQGSEARVANAIGERIQASLARPFAIDMARAQITPCVGAVCLDPARRPTTSAELVKEVEEALAAARQAAPQRLHVRALAD